VVSVIINVSALLAHQLHIWHLVENVKHRSIKLLLIYDRVLSRLVLCWSLDLYAALPAYSD